VRDAVLGAFAQARREPVAAERLEEAKSHARYRFSRTLDNSESIAETLAMFVRFRRSYDTLNALYRQYEALTPDDLLAAAHRYLTDANMVLTTLSHDPLPEAMAQPASLAAFEREARAPTAVPEIIWRTPSPLLRMKLLFNAGSAHDPAGREGLAALAAEMVAGASSKDMRIDEINRALFPMAGSFDAQVDREMTTFTGVIHRDNLDRFADIALKQLLEPGLREDDFTRIKQRQANALVVDLRTNNEEELGKERLQTNIFAGGPYGHTTLGTVAGIDAITLDDVRSFIARAYTQANLTIGLAGDVPDAFLERARSELAALPAGALLPAPQISAHRPRGIEIEIIEKETRSTAISFGHAIEVTRPHPDFAPLWLARAWLGDHRAFHTQLFQRIREVRGLNYGDYAYIEAFPRGMFQFFPDPNRARRAQIFEVWIRPVMPEHAVFALKVALHEVEQLIERGLSEEQLESTRNYLMKNVFVMTKTQDQQLGYALDSRWHGIGDFAMTMREQIAGLTRDRVNEAVRRHLSAENLSVVMITQDAAGLRDTLLADEFTPIAYDAAKPADVLEEDRVIGARKLNLRPDAVRITPVGDVFAR
jgi:zinc protease